MTEYPIPDSHDVSLGHPETNLVPKGSRKVTVAGHTFDPVKISLGNVEISYRDGVGKGVPGPYSLRVLVNGKPVKCTSLSFHAEVGKIPVISVEFYPENE